MAMAIEKGVSQSKGPPAKLPPTILVPERAPPRVKPWVTTAARLPNKHALSHGLFRVALARNSKNTARKIRPYSNVTTGIYSALKRTPYIRGKATKSAAPPKMRHV